MKLTLIAHRGEPEPNTITHWNHCTYLYHHPRSMDSNPRRTNQPGSTGGVRRAMRCRQAATPQGPCVASTG
jgi:hypothetical protein